MASEEDGNDVIVVVEIGVVGTTEVAASVLDCAEDITLVANPDVAPGPG